MTSPPTGDGTWGGAPEPIELRPWAMGDLEALIGLYRDSPDLEHQFPHPVSTLAEARDVVTGAFATTATSRSWAVVVAHAPVGHVAVSHIEPRHQTGWVSYFSARPVRGRGFAGRATAAACTWALAELDVFRLELGHRLDNPASGAVAIAAGFSPEGIQRQKLRYGDERFDVRTYARLASDPTPTADGVRITAN